MERDRLYPWRTVPSIALVRGTVHITRLGYFATYWTLLASVHPIGFGFPSARIRLLLTDVDEGPLSEARNAIHEMHTTLEYYSGGCVQTVEAFVVLAIQAPLALAVLGLLVEWLYLSDGQAYRVAFWWDHFILGGTLPNQS